VARQNRDSQDWSASRTASAVRTDITVDYVVVDPLRVLRATFAAIWGAWRDGFADAVSANTFIAREVFLAQCEDMIATIQDPSGYGVWHVPVVAARVP